MQALAGLHGLKLVAGFHRIAAARALRLPEVPVVVRDAQTEDAGRAVENVASCQGRHEALDADRVGMPTCVASCPPSAAFLWARAA